MKSHRGLSALSLVLAVGVIDCLALSIALFTAISEMRPVLSARILVLSFALVVILMLIATMDEGKRILLSSRSSEALADIRAGFAYALIVFVIGFGLGTIRVLLLVPQLGDTVAVVLETPVILFASWVVSRWCMDRCRVRVDMGARMLVAVVALVTLMSAEGGVSLLVFGKSVAEHLADYRSVAGAIGLAAQVCFASFPVLQAGNSA